MLSTRSFSVLSLSLLALLYPGTYAVPTRREANANAKRGIAYALPGNSGDIQKIAGTAISWEYDWAVAAPDGLPGGIQHVPMQWGSGNIASFQSAVQSSGASAILSFNEPERSDQANLDPQTAASLYKQYIQPLSGSGVRLGAPAISSAPEGKTWLQEFTSACSGCTIDFLALHWYGQGSQYFIQYIEDIHNTFPNYNIWVTEFADTTLNDENTVQSFLQDTTAWLDSTSYIERYSWFDYARSANGLQSNLLDGNGNVNALGSVYLS